LRKEVLFKVAGAGALDGIFSYRRHMVIGI
jgi:hypothetical protein